MIYRDIPGYGICPNVMSSTRNIPYAQTSDFIVKLPNIAASGAVHFMGNLVPEEVKNILKLIHNNHSNVREEKI